MAKKKKKSNKKKAKKKSSGVAIRSWKIEIPDNGAPTLKLTLVGGGKEIDNLVSVFPALHTGGRRIFVSKVLHDHFSSPEGFLLECRVDGIHQHGAAL